MQKANAFVLFFCFLTLNLQAESKGTDTRTFRISKNLSIFNSVFRELDAFYVDTLNYDKMTATAINEMVSRLDPYTVYIPEKETDNLKFMTTGEYGGIGALITKSGKDLYISEPYEGMPAQRNDVRAGDILLEINKKSTANLTVSQVSNLLKGTPNTLVKLKLKRVGITKIIEKEFLREKIQVNPVVYTALVADKVGYVQLSDFTDKSATEMKTAINNLVKNQHIESLVIDIRNNGGGLIDEAVKILGFFVPKGSDVVQTKGKSEFTNRTYKTPTEPVFTDLRIAVLVNRSSASASEIVAGAMQDLDRGIIIGEKTFGKGLVQNIRPIGYGGNLKVTTAKYYIPSGRCIQAIDYAHRNEDGSVGRVPDSLTTEFKTLHGRTVRDGGGIIPDSLTADNRKLNIAYYIFAQNLYFEYANKFVATHPTIAKPSEFELSNEDFDDFVKFLTEKKFTYKSESEKMYAEFLDLARSEGIDKYAAEALKNLEIKIKPDVQRNILDNKADVSELLSLELMKRYYFQKGQVEFSLRKDNDLKLAIRNLTDQALYFKILNINK
ncbi:MAG: peptidase S41 [Porphyromonadaceae bacterium CG2_30_38_12]|nr:MAG: peptidase S41 [Porphyromonadaceae bacterium CG2_30_38_12]